GRPALGSVLARRDAVRARLGREPVRRRGPGRHPAPGCASPAELARRDRAGRARGALGARRSPAREEPAAPAAERAGGAGTTASARVDAGPRPPRRGRPTPVTANAASPCPATGAMAV